MGCAPRDDDATAPGSPSGSGGGCDQDGRSGADRPEPAVRCQSDPPGRRQRGPYVARCAAGKYAWCQCSRSATYPLCDGTHRGTGITPLKVVFDSERTIVWCACGETGNRPYCDGSHSRSS